MNQDHAQQTDALEIEVLGSILRWNACLDDVAESLRAEDFASWPHQQIYAIILNRWQCGLPTDAALLAEDLIRQKICDDVGGTAYIGKLWDSAPTAVNAAYYAQLLRDKARLRELGYAAQQIAHDAEDPDGPVDEVVAAAEKRIMVITERAIGTKVVDLKSLLFKAEDRIDARVRRQQGGEGLIGLSTGFIDLDNITAGLQDSELIILAARPSVGKTALGISIACNVALQGYAALIISLEQSGNELTERLLAREARVDGQHIRNGRLGSAEIEHLIQAGAQLRKANIYISDVPRQNMVKISAQARRLKRQQKIKLVVLDYLQMVEPDDHKAPRYEQVGWVSRRLKQLARELQIPVVALAQLNRASEDRQDKRPRLSDLRESGNVEADADTVLLLHQPLDKSGVLEVIIAKQRNGPTGEITLAYDKKCMRFNNYIPGEPS